MDDTEQFAKACAAFFKEKLFTGDVKPDDLWRRIDAMLYLSARNLLSAAPRTPTIEYLVMGTKGPGGPHLEALLHHLQNRHLTAEFFEAMSHS
jgi:hypothetical protein